MMNENNQSSSQKETQRTRVAQIALSIVALCLVFVGGYFQGQVRNSSYWGASDWGASHETGGKDTTTRLSFVSTTKKKQNSQPLHGESVTPIPAIVIGVDIHGESVKLPLVGVGTASLNDTVAYESVCKSFRVGYTMVDTAHQYKNQKGVGQAIRDCWKRPRSELFVLTKIPGGLTRNEVWSIHLQNLLELQLTYVDHLMTHRPADRNMTPDRATPERRQEEWLALQEIYKTGGARTIGLSRYCPQHIDDVLEVSNIVTPSINQVEYHVGSGDVDGVMEYCRRYNITFMSFSPLCGFCRYEPQDSLISGTLVTEIASHYENVTGSQVALRFIVQQALENMDDNSNDNMRNSPKLRMGAVIPRSNTLDHIVSNLDIFRFSLTEEDMARLHLARKPAGTEGDCSTP